MFVALLRLQQLHILPKDDKERLADGMCLTRFGLQRMILIMVVLVVTPPMTRLARPNHVMLHMPKMSLVS
jgi:hypothetical protein